jgi:hypothetical protein
MESLPTFPIARDGQVFNELVTKFNRDPEDTAEKVIAGRLVAAIDPHTQPKGI